MDKTTIDPIQDIAALANYAPRKAAIEMILAGRFDDYLAWARGDGTLAALGYTPDDPAAMDWLDEAYAMPLDEELTQRISGATEGIGNFSERMEREASIYRQAFESIDHFLCSPLEIALRAGTPELFEKLLARLTRPQRKFEQGRQNRAGGWTSLQGRLSAGRSFQLRSARRWLAKLLDWYDNGAPLLLLALLLGKPEAAAAMQRSGWGPEGFYGYADMAAPMNDVLKEIEAADPAQVSAFADTFAIRSDMIAEAGKWLGERSRLTSELENLAKEFDNLLYEQDSRAQDHRDKIIKLVDSGALVTGYALTVATEANDLDLLCRLFAAGGNPNAVHSNGFNYLAAVNADKLTPEALQIWLDQGALTIYHRNADDPFEFSTLTEWAWKGRLGLIRQAIDQAVGAIPLTYQNEVEVGKVKRMQTFSPLLATAVSRGHVELAAWLIRDKGLSLDDWDSWEGGEWKPCRTFAPKSFLKELKSALARNGGKA